MWHVLSLFSGTGFLLEYHDRLCFNTNTVTFTNYFFKLQFSCIFTTYQTSPNICLTIVLYYCFTVYLNKARSYVTKKKKSVERGALFFVVKDVIQSHG